MLSRGEDLAERLWPERLQELQDALSRSFDVPVLVVEPSGRPLTACEDLSQFCRRFTRCIPLSRPCLGCGRAEPADEPPEIANNPLRRGPAIHHCPLGVADIAVPIRSAGEIIGYLLGPQVVVADRDEDNAAVQTHASADECTALLARAARLRLDELLRLGSGLVAVSCLLGDCASARRRNLRLAERLREQCRWARAHTVTDAVTGVANRRRFMEALASEVRRVRRYRRSMSLAVVQINSFRTINDEFGHDVGDAVLAAVASTLTSTLRQTDSVGRVSGDAFGILMPETARNQAVVAVGRVAMAIEDLNASGDLPVEVQTSVGIADTVVEPEELLRLAYEAAALASTAGTPAVHAQ